MFMPESRITNGRRYWLLAALLVFLSVTAKADTLPVADYQRNLKRAITALDTLQQIDENETVYDYDNRLDQTIAAVREALPEHQAVQASEEVCNVDNSWLHAALNDLKAAPFEQRTTKLTQLIERLRAVEERVGYERGPAASDSKDQRKQKLESILARPEFASEARGQNALTRLLEDFIRWIQQFLPKPVQVETGRASWMSIVVQVLVVIVALLVLFYVVKILFTRLGGTRHKGRAKKSKVRIVLGEQLKPEDTATDLLSEAEALARSGDLRAAIRKAYIALLVELGDRKLIALAQHKTNRDYLNSVRSIPLLHSRMRAMTDSFEQHWYGFVDATENDWLNFRSRYQAALQTQN